MNEREVFLKGKIADLTEEKEQGVSTSRAEVIDKEISIHEAELQAIKDAELAQEQAAAQQERIDKATEQAAYFLDTLVIEGFSMRDMCAGEAEYQLLRIAVQDKIITMSEDASKQLAEESRLQLSLQYQVAELKGIIENGKAANATLTRENNDLRSHISQINLEKDDLEAKRDAAVRELEDGKAEIERLNSQVDDLRKEIAVGARNAYKVTDVEHSEQIKQLTDQIKASKIKVTDMVFTDYTHVTYTATLLQDLPSENKKFGEKIVFPSIFKSKYINIEDAAEVERFRQQFANKEAVQDIPLDEPVQDSLEQEAPFPELPSAIAPEIPAVPAPMVEGSPSDSGQGQTVEERLSALEAHVFGYVKGQVA